MMLHPIREYRKANGLTQSAFGVLIDVGVNTVSRWENGERYPSPTETLRIRTATEGAVTEVELLHWWEKARSRAGRSGSEREVLPQVAE